MFQTLIDSLRIHASNDDFDSRRSHERRSMDSCIAVIDGKAFPVENWSRGGLLIKGDERLFALDETKPVTIKFKLIDRVMDVTQPARILRKERGKFAMQFAPLPESVDRRFQQVVDDYVLQEFANSQQL